MGLIIRMLDCSMKPRESNEVGLEEQMEPGGGA